MKKIVFILFIGCVCMSCKTTAISINPVERITQVAKHPNMEFIGFQNINQNNPMVKDFGTELEKLNIAINTQSSYFSSFNLQNLASYNTKNRYVAFINTEKNIYVHNDAVEDRPGLGLGGWIVAGCTCFALFPVYVPMICAAKRNICEASLIGKYTIFVYDTQQNEMIKAIPIEINVSDRYTGQYLHKDTNRNNFDNHYKNLLWNKFIETFLEINAQLK